MDDFNMQNNGNPAPQQPQGGKGFSITSMVLGIVAVAFSCCFYYVSFPCGVVGLILGGISLKKKLPGKKMATAGVVLSIISLAFAVLALTLLASMVASMPWAAMGAGLAS